MSAQQPPLGRAPRVFAHAMTLMSTYAVDVDFEAFIEVRSLDLNRLDLPESERSVCSRPLADGLEFRGLFRQPADCTVDVAIASLATTSSLFHQNRDPFEAPYRLSPGLPLVSVATEKSWILH